MKKFLNKLILNFYMNKKDIVLVLAVDGMGDYIYLFSLLQEFKKFHNIKNLYFIARAKHQYYLAKIYNCADKVIYMKKIPKIFWKFIPKYNGEKFFVANFFQPCIYNNLNDDKISAPDGLKFFLGLPLDTKPILKVNYSDEKIKKKIYSKLNENSIRRGGVKKNTVLISPYSNSLKTNIPEEYWLNIASELKNNGYTPVFNVKQKNFHSYETIFPKKEEIQYYAEYFGTLLSLRSGLCDYILTLTNAKCIVIYPRFDENDESIKIGLKEAYGNFNLKPDEFIFHKWDLEKIGFNNVYQLFYDKEKNVNDIINIIKNN